MMKPRIFFPRNEFYVIVLQKANVNSGLSHHAILQLGHKIMSQTLHKLISSLS